MLLAQHRQAHTPGSPCGGKVGWMHTSARVIVAVYAVLLVAAFAIVPGTAKANMDRPIWVSGDFWEYAVVSGTGPAQTVGTLRMDVPGSGGAKRDGAEGHLHDDAPQGNQRQRHVHGELLVRASGKLGANRRARQQRAKPRTVQFDIVQLPGWELLHIDHLRTPGLDLDHPLGRHPRGDYRVLRGPPEEAAGPGDASSTADVAAGADGPRRPTARFDAVMGRFIEPPRALDRGTRRVPSSGRADPPERTSGGASTDGTSDRPSRGTRLP